MLVTLDFADVTANAVKGEINSKTTNLYMVVRVNQSNLVEAQERFRNYRNVVALHYEGDLEYLKLVDLQSSKPVFCRFPLSEIVVDSFDWVLSAPEGLRVVIDTPADYSDMRAIKFLCEKYGNLYFAGGKFFRLEGCRLGAIQREDLPRKINEMHISLLTSGEGSVYPIVTLSELDSFTFYTEEVKAPRSKGGTKAPRPARIKAETPVKKVEQTPKQPKGKKNKLASLLDLVPAQADNF